MKRTKKILMSLALVGAVAAAVGLGSAAFFSDTETSTDNVLQAGEIDLKIDNYSYYNGVLSTETSWRLTDLTVERFFDFLDLKPGDWGEDTISLHVTSNPAWLCANVELTSNPENGILDPEAEAGDESSGLWRGELVKELKFIFWADDGDNVWECYERGQQPGELDRALWAEVDGRICERPLLRGVPAQLFPQEEGGVRFPIADASGDGPFNVPLQPGEKYYVGKYWCFGEMGLDPVLWDAGEDPTVHTGFTCDGAPVGNMSQGDGLTADITFEAVQYRNNTSFVCNEPEVEPVHVTSAVLYYGPTGWGGWSCPADTTVVEGSLVVSGGDLAQTFAWKPGATTGAVNYPNTPFGYTYGPGETGYIAQNDNDSGESIVLDFDCMPN